MTHKDLLNTGIPDKFGKEKENVGMWYKLTRTYFKNQNFTIFEEKTVNRNFCSQFKVKKSKFEI